MPSYFCFALFFLVFVFNFLTYLSTSPKKEKGQQMTTLEKQTLLKPKQNLLGQHFQLKFYKSPIKATELEDCIISPL